MQLNVLVSLIAASMMLASLRGMAPMLLDLADDEATTNFMMRPGALKG